MFKELVNLVSCLINNLKKIVLVSYLGPWKMSQSSKGNGDRWIEMGTRDVASGEDDDHDSKATGGSKANKRL